MTVDLPTQETFATQMSPELLLTGMTYQFMFKAAGAADSFGALIDNIRLTRHGEVVIPEPATYLLVGLGLIGFFYVGRRRRRA